MAAPKYRRVELGFLEKSEPFLLNSRFFPSKFGGKPAWLSLKSLPSAEDLLCPRCSKPTTFLLQVYCSDTEIEKHDSFHRTIFIFVCKTPACSQSNSAENFHVFRSQLPRQNDFYSAEPPVERTLKKEIDASLHNTICVVCGCHGSKSCGQCQKVYYCSKDHQRIDWKAGHKKICAKDSVAESRQQFDHSFLFPEMEIETEEEEFVEKAEKEDEKQKEDFPESPTEKGDVPASELEEMAYKETEGDKQLSKFKKRIASEPEQVLRYCKGGEPLWIAPQPVPADVPDCSCGSKRQFEFQILPQLLSHMKVDTLGASLDWGVVCVYTCKDSCSTGNQYRREYVVKQDVS